MKHLRTSILLICVFSSYVLHAEASISYSVTPRVIDEEVTARDIIQKQIRITNTADQPVTVYPTVNNISLDEGGTIQEFLPAVESDRSTSLSTWIEIKRGGMDIPVGESRTIDLTIRINPEPKPGTYHAFIGFGNGQNSTEAETQVQKGTAPGVIVTITVIEKKSVFLKLSRFVIDKFVTGVNDSQAVYRIHNPGDETLIPVGEVIIYDSKGVEVASVDLNADKMTVAPGEEKEFLFTIPSDGLFGKYKAYLDVEYGIENKASVQDTTFFYAFPMKIMLPIIAVILAIVVLTSLYLHKRYYDVEDDGSELVHVHVRESRSEAKEHDIDLTKTHA
jgi:hypothetical protein